MASLQTKIGIWNAALDVLKERPLASVADTDATALWLARNYNQQRDYLLERYIWKFALTRASIAADGTAPLWDWQFRYAIPTDALRILPPTVNGAWDGVPIPFEQESGYILMNYAGPLRLRYINRITNEGTFSNGFCECLALRLAARMAHWLTGKQSMSDAVEAAYRETTSEVIRTEAVQVAQDHYYDTEILADRVTFS